MHINCKVSLDFPPTPTPLQHKAKHQRWTKRTIGTYPTRSNAKIPCWGSIHTNCLMISGTTTIAPALAARLEKARSGLLPSTAASLSRQILQLPQLNHILGFTQMYTKRLWSSPRGGCVDTIQRRPKKDTRVQRNGLHTTRLPVTSLPASDLDQFILKVSQAL
jgi:hypothetical protein